MAANVYVMEAANLFAGNEDPSSSNHLTLSDLKLPAMEENYVDHQAGGAPVSIEIDTIFARLESTFNLAGWSPQVQTLIGSWSQANMIFTAYGVIRDRRSGEALEAKAVLGGRLGRANPANWRRNELQHWEYAIRSITHYELYMDASPIYMWDFFTNQLQVGGIDQNLDVNNILRIPASPVVI